MMAILLVDGPILNYIVDITSIIIYTLLAAIFLNYYKIYRYKGFLSISFGIFVLGIHFFLRLFFFLFLQDEGSFIPQLFLRLMLLSWGLSFAFMLHGIYSFRYKNNSALLVLVYLFYGAFMGLSMLLPEVDLIYSTTNSTKVLVVPTPIAIMTTIIHFIFVFELISILIDGRKQFHQDNKTSYLFLAFGGLILIFWLTVIFPTDIQNIKFLEPFISLVGFSLWSIGIYKHPNFLFYPKYIPHMLFVSRMNGILIYNHDFLCSRENKHKDKFPDYSLMSGLFASLRIASTEIFPDYHHFLHYNVGSSTAVIHQKDDFLITLLVDQNIHFYETLLEKFGFESEDALLNLKKNYTMNLNEPVQEVFGLIT